MVISSSENFPQEAKIINQLFEAGMEFFHLRKHGKSESEVNDLLKQILPEFHPNISLHQHHFLAAKNSINRLHFTDFDRRNTKENQLQQLKKEGFKLSTSIHEVDIIAEQQYFN